MRFSSVAASLSTAAALLVSARLGRAQTSGTAPSVIRDEMWKFHAIGLRFETDGSSFSYGAYYAHYWASARSVDGSGTFGVAGAGLQARLVTEGHRDINAILLGPFARAAMPFASADLSIDLSLGPGKAVIAGNLGVLYSLVYADLGYDYQFPLPGFDRPSSMASHQFGLRIMIPVHKYGVVVRENLK